MVNWCFGLIVQSSLLLHMCSGLSKDVGNIQVYELPSQKHSSYEIFSNSLQLIAKTAAVGTGTYIGFSLFNKWRYGSLLLNRQRNSSVTERALYLELLKNESISIRSIISEIENRINSYSNETDTRMANMIRGQSKHTGTLKAIEQRLKDFEETNAKDIILLNDTIINLLKRIDLKIEADTSHKYKELKNETMKMINSQKDFYLNVIRNYTDILTQRVLKELKEI
jgi:hypothetical protein